MSVALSASDLNSFRVVKPRIDDLTVVTGNERAGNLFEVGDGGRTAVRARVAERPFVGAVGAVGIGGHFILKYDPHPLNTSRKIHNGNYVLYVHTGHRFGSRRPVERDE